MTHIIKTEIGLKCPQAVLRSAASLQEKTHFALHFFFATQKKQAGVCVRGRSLSLCFKTHHIFLHLFPAGYQTLEPDNRVISPKLPSFNFFIFFFPSCKLEKGFTCLGEGAIACALPYTEKFYFHCDLPKSRQRAVTPEQCQCSSDGLKSWRLLPAADSAHAGLFGQGLIQSCQASLSTLCEF